MNNLQTRTIWITGASSGIGAALARVFAEQGATLILSSRNQQQLDRVKQSLPQRDKHLVLPLDLSNQEDFPAKVDDAVAHTGVVDILVNNGGISQRSLAIDTDISVDRQIMEVDYFGTIALTKAILPHMVQGRSGTIVSISSIAGKIGNKRRTAYCAAKHALVGFMDALRAELAEYGVKVCVVCPGFVKTNISVNALTANRQPFGKMEEAISNGIPVDEFAEKMVKALLKGKEEIIIARGVALYGYHLHRFFPNLFHRIIARLDTP